MALARCFHLTRAEALLLDVHAADQGHCLLIDISATHGRGKRRLVLIRSAQERQVLDQVLRAFERVDCGLDGPEGNYRQRLYRLKCYLAELDAPQEQAVPGGLNLGDTSIWPSNTVTAGPVIRTGWPGPCQAIDSSPPRALMRTGESSRPRRMPATAAAQAPVPQARVSPAPRSYTRNFT